MSASLDLPDIGRRIAANLDSHFDPAQARIRQVLTLAEEVGEFVGAFRRAEGMARRSGPWSDVSAELADVVITAYVTASVLGIDLAAAIEQKTEVVFTRGWREPQRRPHGAVSPGDPDWVAGFGPVPGSGSSS